MLADIAAYAASGSLVGVVVVVVVVVWLQDTGMAGVSPSRCHRSCRLKPLACSQCREFR